VTGIARGERFGQSAEYAGQIATLTIVIGTVAERETSGRTHAQLVRDACLVVVPALNEEETVANVVRNLRRRRFERIRVIDNGSCDATAQRARVAGAEVLYEPQCGYGQACQLGLSNIPRGIAWILFCDADGSDDLDDVDLITEAAEEGADLILGNRFTTKSGREAMTRVQRFGNRLISKLIEYGWGFRFADFGPLRLIRRQALDDIDMRERSFGWNVVMQIRALEAGLKIREVPVRYRPRQGGKSKISGNLLAAVCAGFGILQAMVRLYFAPRRAPLV
jgi:glycosyltransferase involved in cell wall biosynthesis